MKTSLFRLGLTVLSSAAALAAVEPASPFGHHMVLQRDRPVPIWGQAAPGETVTARFGGQEVTTRADTTGRWRLDLAAMPASTESRTLVLVGSATPQPVSFEDVLVGEVWLCGGQSNMERQLGLRAGQMPLVGWEAEVAGAHHPSIRELTVTQTRADTPQSRVQAKWSVCTPENVVNFTAVGYYFARDLHNQLGVPVGIIHSSWGGTAAEAWTSAEGLAVFPEFADELAQAQESLAHPEQAKKKLEQRLTAWFAAVDPGSQGQTWSAPNLDTRTWENIQVPMMWEDAGHVGFDGIGWYRKTFDLPAGWAGQDLELRLGAIDDFDTTWCNGVWVGQTTGWDKPRSYRLPANVLKPTGNVIAVRVLDNGGGGGLWDPRHSLELVSAQPGSQPLSLNGPWQLKLSAKLDWSNPPPAGTIPSTIVPTVLYNGMIAPLIPYALRGVAFYQGEANAGRPDQYRRLLPALIGDWRQRWQQGEFPFLFVQIAPFQGQPPEIREAQFLAWKETNGTAMVVTVDCGDAKDIHPTHKEPVGQRLALAARALAYGETLEYSGPAFQRAEVHGDKMVLHFSHVGKGLVAPGGKLEGFTLAGADGRFYPADAVIAGDTVVVSARNVSQPQEARYAWANVAQGNLFNRQGLPASPFRTSPPPAAARSLP